MEQQPAIPSPEVELERFRVEDQEFTRHEAERGNDQLCSLCHRQLGDHSHEKLQCPDAVTYGFKDQVFEGEV